MIHAIVKHRIPEAVVDGKRLGRHFEHDSRSLLFTPATAPIVSVTHPSVGLPLDQGKLGSCTANALCGALNSSPEQRQRTEQDALTLYGKETSDEGQPYPPNDPGGTGVAVCRAAKELGWISSYSTPLGVDQALGALVLRPVITGVNWYDSFDTPDENGLVVIKAGARIRGGHEFVGDEIDAPNKLVWFWNSWGLKYGKGGRFCMSWDTWGQLLTEGGDVTVPRSMTHGFLGRKLSEAEEAAMLAQPKPHVLEIADQIEFRLGCGGANFPGARELYDGARKIRDWQAACEKRYADS